MMRFGTYTTLQREEALADAERKLDRQGHSPIAKVPVNKLKIMPKLFQPREFSPDTRKTTNSEHVKSLTRAVELFGELDPPLVIRLKHKGFVIVDGHHTLEAYQKAGKTEITCEWFSGTVREAMDQSMLRNVKDKLSVPQDDKMQEGWKRVLMDGYSIEHIKTVCGISPRQVSYMRLVKRAALAKTQEGEQFRERLREGTKHYLAVPNLRDELDVVDHERSAEDALWRLKQLSWLRARLIYKGVPEKTATEEEEAVLLERALNSKMADWLKRKPRVTALALKLHDRRLPEQLMDRWLDLENNPEALRTARDIKRRKAEEFMERSQKAAKVAAEKHAAKREAKLSGPPGAMACNGSSGAPEAAGEAAEAVTPHAEAVAPLKRQERWEQRQAQARLLGILRRRLIERSPQGPEAPLGT
jgi:ParB-like chromosome segregation protein Spo0J